MNPLTPETNGPELFCLDMLRQDMFKDVNNRPEIVDKQGVKLDIYHVLGELRDDLSLEDEAEPWSGFPSPNDEPDYRPKPEAVTPEQEKEMTALRTKVSRGTLNVSLEDEVWYVYCRQGVTRSRINEHLAKHNSPYRVNGYGDFTYQIPPGTLYVAAWALCNRTTGMDKELTRQQIRIAG